jgi:hypothetical protein
VSSVHISSVSCCFIQQAAGMQRGSNHLVHQQRDCDAIGAAADVEHAPVVSLPFALLGGGHLRLQVLLVVRIDGTCSDRLLACLPQAVEHARHLRELAEASSEPTSMSSPAFGSRPAPCQLLIVPATQQHTGPLQPLQSCFPPRTFTKMPIGLCCTYCCTLQL